MDSASQILDIAERRMRKAGFNAVSYRDIAAEMNLKSASLHYHFPKKEDLGVALVQRYSERFEALVEADTADLETPQEKITVFVRSYRNAFEEDGLVCLCAVLGAEAPGLPDPVASEVKQFFERMIDWLTAQYEDLSFAAPRAQAQSAISLLQGAMIVSSATGDEAIFEASANTILVAFKPAH